MSAKVFNTEIDGHKITIATIPATEALGLQARIASLIAKMASKIDLASIAPSLGNLQGKTVEEMLSGDTAGVISSLFSAAGSVDPNELSALIINLCDRTYVDGSNEGFDITYADTGLAMKSAFFVIKTQFLPVFQGLLSNGTRQQVKQDSHNLNDTVPM